MRIPEGKAKYYILFTVLLGALVYFFIADAGHDEPRLIIVGDSLSTTHESWPNYLRQMAPRWNVHVMAQNGRTIRDFSLPRDLWTTGRRNETVVYFLGGNDILQRNPLAHARHRLEVHINFLLERNFKVLLMVPPTFGLAPNVYGLSNEEHRALIESYRGTRPNLWVYDVDDVWDNEQTYDNIHPNAELSLTIAMAVNYVLLTNIQ